MTIAPAPELAQICQLAPRQPPGSLQAPSFIRIARIIASARVYHCPAAFAMPSNAALRCQLGGQPVGEFFEIARVVNRILQLFVAQRPLRPIGLLTFFADSDGEAALNQRGQTELLYPQQLRCDHRVEDFAVRSESSRGTQYPQVVIAGVEDQRLCC